MKAEAPASARSFQEVMKMVQSGEPLPNVKQVDDSPADPQATVIASATQAPEKPWLQRRAAKVATSPSGASSTVPTYLTSFLGSKEEKKNEPEDFSYLSTPTNSSMHDSLPAKDALPTPQTTPELEGSEGDIRPYPLSSQSGPVTQQTPEEAPEEASEEAKPDSIPLHGDREPHSDEPHSDEPTSPIQTVTETNIESNPTQSPTIPQSEFPIPETSLLGEAQNAPKVEEI